MPASVLVFHDKSGLRPKSVSNVMPDSAKKSWMVVLAAVTAKQTLIKQRPVVHGNSARSQGETEVYLLVDRDTGETKKIGITSNRNWRYSDVYLDSLNVQYVREWVYQSRKPAIIHENIRLVHHYIVHGELPEFNKTFRQSE